MNVYVCNLVSTNLTILESRHHPCCVTKVYLLTRSQMVDGHGCGRYQDQFFDESGIFVFFEFGQILNSDKIFVPSSAFTSTGYLISNCRK